MKIDFGSSSPSFRLNKTGYPMPQVEEMLFIESSLRESSLRYLFGSMCPQNEISRV